MKAAGEIYFIGEKDLRSKEVTPYFKVGIVRENPENADRDSTQRLLEHQTRHVIHVFAPTATNGAMSI
jgi:hypothetical protein